MKLGVKPWLLVKSQEAQGLGSAGMSGTAVSREKEGPKYVHLPSPRVPGKSPANGGSSSGQGRGIWNTSVCFIGVIPAPSLEPGTWRTLSVCLLNE